MDYAPIEGHTSKDIRIAQIALCGFFKKKSEESYIDREDNQSGMGGGKYNQNIEFCKELI